MILHNATIFVNWASIAFNCVLLYLLYNCRCMHLCTQIQMYVCALRPEVEVWYLSSDALHLFFEAGFLTQRETLLTQLGSLNNEL